MKNKIFFKYLGSNGAIYIFNLSTFRDIYTSLEFYKPLGLKRKLLKYIFTIYLQILSILSNLFNIKKLENIEEIRKYLSIKIDDSVNFNLDNKSSIFISSTGDKVIVNHNNVFFEKFAFLKSYIKACNEIKIYELLNNKEKIFLTSTIKDINIQNNFCSFKLFNNFIEKKEKKIDDFILIDSLVDFFNISNIDKKNISFICDDLKNNNYIKNNLIDLLTQIKKKYKDLEIKVGLTHWDFKIWNLQAYKNKLLIYDFEETKNFGLPMEDFYNYYIDSKIMSDEKTIDIMNFLNSQKFNNLKHRYCEKMNLNINNDLLLILYLLNRIIFYNKNGAQYIVNRYSSLLDLVKKQI